MIKWQVNILSNLRIFRYNFLSEIDVKKYMYFYD